MAIRRHCLLRRLSSPQGATILGKPAQHFSNVFLVIAQLLVVVVVAGAVPDRTEKTPPTTTALSLSSSSSSSSSSLSSSLSKHCLLSMAARGGTTTTPETMGTTTTTATTTTTTATTTSSDTETDAIHFVFSDVDGTLVHNPDHFLLSQDDNDNDNDNDSELLHLPPSSTGMQGVVSVETLRLLSQLRHERQVSLALISGMRTTTFFQRVAHLPRADAYATENGGRIFYPTQQAAASSTNCWGPFTSLFSFAPEPTEFYLVEDEEWKGRMQNRLVAAGPDAYDKDDKDTTRLSLEQRRSVLWKFAQDLLSAHPNLVLDDKGYATNFRIHRKGQPELFDQLSLSLLESSLLPPQLATTINLGAMDVYPQASGKKHCCEYLARRFSKKQKLGLESHDDILRRFAVCLCDDDNDLEMARACRHAYLPSVSSRSMQEAIQQTPQQFTVAAHNDVVGPRATEEAVRRILQLRLCENQGNQKEEEGKKGPPT